MAEAIVAALAAATDSPDDDEEDDAPPEPTIRDIIRTEVRAAIGVDDDEDDTEDADDDEEDLPLELSHAALRHIVTARFPTLNVDDEIDRVGGLTLAEDGSVSGEPTYQPSDAVRASRTASGRRTPRRGEPTRGQPVGKRKGAQSTNGKSLGEMTETELADKLEAEGDVNGAQLFRASARQKTAANATE